MTVSKNIPDSTVQDKVWEMGRLMTMSFQYQIGDVVCIRGASLRYKVIAVTGSMITIIVVNPQPDGQYLPFNSTSLQSVDESRIEKVES